MTSLFSHQYTSHLNYTSSEPKLACLPWSFCLCWLVSVVAPKDLSLLLFSAIPLVRPLLLLREAFLLYESTFLAKGCWGWSVAMSQSNPCLERWASQSLLLLECCLQSRDHYLLGSGRDLLEQVMLNEQFLQFKLSGIVFQFQNKRDL